MSVDDADSSDEAMGDPAGGVGGAAVDDDALGEAGKALEAAGEVGLLVSNGDGDRHCDGESARGWVIGSLTGSLRCWGGIGSLSVRRFLRSVVIEPLARLA